MNSDTRLLNAILRNDFGAFVHRCFQTLNPGGPFVANWHHEAIAYELSLVMAGKTKRLIINMPPRHLKSLMASVAFPAFLLGHDPKRRLFCISYASDLAMKHARDFRSVVETRWFRNAFPQMQIRRSLDSEIHTTAQGYRMTTSIGASITGLGGGYMIIDDPLKPIDAQSDTTRSTVNNWFFNTLVSRLDNKETGVIIVVMQRVHLHDLTGFLTQNSNEWRVLSLPAIAESDERIAIGENEFHLRRAGEALHPSYESLATLEKLRNELGSDLFAAQYQQAPVPPGGAMIKRAWLRYYDTLPTARYPRIIQSWDTAAKHGAQNDWSVCTTWLVIDKNYYLLDITRGRYEYPRLKATAIALAERYHPETILIEDASTGTALAQEMTAAGLGLNVNLVPIEHDKIGRVYVCQGKFEAGLVHFPKGAAFLPELETELLSFPQGRYDDQVDSITQALSYKGSGYTLDYIR